MDNSFLFLYFLLAGLADSPCDLLTLIDAEKYFESRRVEVTPARMQELASTQPRDAATQAAQLLAIRWLGEHQAMGTRDMLMTIAAGGAGQDPHGFAQDYARRALAALDGQRPGDVPLPRKDLRETLQWFSKDAVTVAALDVSASWANKPFAIPSLLAQSEEERLKASFVLRPSIFVGKCAEEFYRFIDQVGNFRIQTVAAACLPAAQPGGQARWVVRVTGRGDHRRLVEWVREEWRCSLTREQQNPGDALITMLKLEEGEGTLVLIGDTDLILTTGSGQLTEDLAVAEKVLEVRAGRQADVFHGPLAADLEGVPGNAAGLLVGETPEEVRKELMQQFHLAAVPQRGALYVTVDEARNLDLRFRGKMRNPAEAQDFVAAFMQSQAAEVARLESLPPKGSTAVVLETVKSLQVEVEGASVRGGVRISGDLPAAWGEIQELAIGLAIGESIGRAIRPALEMMLLVCFIAWGIILGGTLLIVFVALRQWRRLRKAGRTSQRVL